MYVDERLAKSMTIVPKRIHNPTWFFEIKKDNLKSPYRPSPPSKRGNLNNRATPLVFLS